MKIRYLLLLFIICSCKTDKLSQDTSITPEFNFEVERNVDIPIDEQTKNALKALSGLNLQYFEECDKHRNNEYEVDFYFTINNEIKNLIIIKSLIKLCVREGANVSRSISKFTIPIEKISGVSVHECLVPSIIVGNADYSIYITIEYGNKSIREDYVTARGCCDDIFYNEDYIMDNSISINTDKINAKRVENNINSLIKAFKE